MQPGRPEEDAAEAQGEAKGHNEDGLQASLTTSPSGGAHLDLRPAGAPTSPDLTSANLCLHTCMVMLLCNQQEAAMCIAKSTLIALALSPHVPAMLGLKRLKEFNFIMFSLFFHILHRTEWSRGCRGEGQQG